MPKKLHTAQTILELIETLSRRDRNRVFEFVNCHPNNEAVSELWQAALEAHRMFDQLWRATERLWGDNATSVRKQLGLENGESVLVTLRQKVDRLQPTRGMTQENLETLSRFLALVNKHGSKRGSKMKALTELVDLPAEQNKEYVKHYRQSKDMEAVRHRIKGLENTFRKSQTLG
jgi:hypothetical protein